MHTYKSAMSYLAWVSQNSIYACHTFVSTHFCIYEFEHIKKQKVVQLSHHGHSHKGKAQNTILLCSPNLPFLPTNQHLNHRYWHYPRDTRNREDQSVVTCQRIHYLPTTLFLLPFFDNVELY